MTALERELDRCCRRHLGRPFADLPEDARKLARLAAVPLVARGVIPEVAALRGISRAEDHMILFGDPAAPPVDGILRP